MRPRLFLLILITSMILPLPTRAQQKPFTRDQVEGMVRDDFGDESGAKLIEQRGIDFAREFHLLSLPVRQIVSFLAIFGKPELVVREHMNLSRLPIQVVRSLVRGQFERVNQVSEFHFGCHALCKIPQITVLLPRNCRSSTKRPSPQAVKTERVTDVGAIHELPRRFMYRSHAMFRRQAPARS